MEKTRRRVTKKEEPQEEKESILTLSTGCTPLDCALSGGLYGGKIINIAGPKQVGKSWLVTETIAQARKLYGDRVKWKYDDTERRYNLDTQSLYNFKILPDDPIEREASFTMNDFKKNVCDHANSMGKDDIGIYVLDSFDQLTTEDELNRIKKQITDAKDYSSEDLLEQIRKAKGSFRGEKPKELGEFFRFLAKTIRDKNYYLIMISQARMNMDTFGPKYLRNGGEAFNHMASQIFWLFQCEEIKPFKTGPKSRTIGITTRAKVDKNCGKPYRECFIDILYDYGVDDIKSCLCFLYDLRTDTGKMKEKIPEMIWKDQKFTDLKSIIEHIENNNEEEELKEAVRNKWQEIEDSIAPNRKGRF